MSSAIAGEVKTPQPKSLRRRLVKGGLWIGGGTAALLISLIGVCFLFLGRVPQSYSSITDPIEPPSPAEYAAMELDGFDSPYLGHTGSWDGRGGAMWGASKVPDLESEVEMGLRWTFMPVHWREMEPEGPVDLAKAVPPAWQELDTFVIQAQKRKLNILMQRR